MRIWDALILLALIGAAVYFGHFHRAQVLVIARQIEAKFVPCRNSITYSIGSTDTRFGISKTILAADLKKAEAIWEKPSDKDLFEYNDTGGDVVVNLVYDYRQQASDKIAAYGIQIDKSKSSFDVLKAQYDSLSARIEREKTDLDTHAVAYDARQKAYNVEVAKWNRQGGAPPAEYDRLQAEKVALNQNAQRLKAMGAQVNADIDTLNVIGISLNQLIMRLNLNVEKYNQAGAATGGEFEEGQYISEMGSQRIDIYEYSNHTELVRVLAHEFGHALGLDHVLDTQAIMYKVNQGRDLSLTQDDITALNTRCTSGYF